MTNEYITGLNRKNEKKKIINDVIIRELGIETENPKQLKAELKNNIARQRD